MPTTPALASALALALLTGSPANAAGEAPQASIERGRALLAQYQCGACHAIPGVPSAGGQVAQPLTAWGRRSYIAGRVPNRQDLLVRWIVEPRSLVPGTAMPAMGVAEHEARAMAAYLFALE
jgi:mono/diheme cytochrome c family protein